jgi:hypothetical protein
MDNLRLYGGKVPIATGHPEHPITLVEFPTHAEFEALYKGTLRAENLVRQYEMLLARSKGATLSDAGKLGAVTKERVRQIEARFLRLMRRRHKSLA